MRHASAKYAALMPSRVFAFLQVVCPVSHTLYDPRAVIAANGGKPPLTYTARAQCLLALHWC
jgi:hypothetical protein